MLKPFVFGLFVTFVFAADLAHATATYDVVVYGATPAGISSAIQAARLGRTTALIAERQHIGGMTASGLTATDMNNYNLIGGIGREFYKKIYNYYRDTSVWKNQSREDYFLSIRDRVYSGISEKDKIQWVFESHVSENILLEMVHASGVKLYLNGELSSREHVSTKNNKILSIKIDDKTNIYGDVFIDASYTGDLMSYSGATNTIGREPRSKYGESLAGIRQSPDPHNATNKTPRPRDIPFVNKKIHGHDGDGDELVQAYCYRMTLTNNPNNMKKFPLPRNYDRSLYIYLLDTISKMGSPSLHQIMTFTPMPNGKTDTNGIDFVGANYRYPDASPAERRRIEQHHKDFTLGMFYFLGTDPEVPQIIRDEMSQWGLARDEFINSGNFPHQIYVREARRLIGDYIITQMNAEGKRSSPNPIAYASYSMDSHIVSRFLNSSGHITTEGNFYKKSSAFGISYQSIVPRRGEISNLIVPVTLSASHVAFGSIRMEPTYFTIGQAAGAAASIASRDNLSVQNVPYFELISILRDNGHVIPIETDNISHRFIVTTIYMSLTIIIFSIFSYCALRLHRHARS